MELDLVGYIPERSVSLYLFSAIRPFQMTNHHYFEVISIFFNFL